MAKATITIEDFVRDDGRRGVRIHKKLDKPLTLKDVERACVGEVTAAHLCFAAAVQAAGQVCDEIGYVIETTGE